MQPFRARASRLALAVSFIVPLLMVLCAPTARGAGGLSWPLEGTVVRGFERPVGPYGEGGHQGLDISAGPGKAVAAAGGGRVAWVGEVPRGVFVSIEHAGGVRSTYLDLRDVLVGRGDRVLRGQRIASVSGSRDDSSPCPHLHFDTYLNGQPVDPRLLFAGMGAGSFIRLCPVESPGGAGAPGAGGAPAGTGLAGGGHGEPGAPRTAGGPSLLRRGACALGRGVASGVTFAWDRVIRPAGLAVGRFCSRAWANRYVQAVTAGLAAALVVVAGVVAAFLLLPVSLVTAIVAGIAGAAACLAMAVYYAVSSGSDFAFGSCLLKGLAAGMVVAAGVISWTALSPAVFAGWAKTGLAGLARSAAWNGVFSTLFDTGLDYLATGRFSPGRAAVAFSVGAIAGGAARVIRRGMTTGRFIRLFSVTADAEVRFQVLGRSAVVLLERASVRLEGFVYLGRRLALEFGGKVAYVLAWGSLTAGLNVASSALSHRPITATGIISAFTAGAVMGAIALSFGGKGIGGLLERVALFGRRIPAAARSLAAKLAGKGMSRGLDNLAKRGLRKALKEKEARIE